MERTPEIYGTLPEQLGMFDISPKEMMFWLYCPVKVPGSTEFVIPNNLRQYDPLMMAVIEDEDIFDKYVYITAKTLYVSPENPGNRPGWHSDGFLTDDINYIWYDSNPTIFYHDGLKHSFTKDHAASMPEMDRLCEDPVFWWTFPRKSLMRLDETVLHKVDTDIEGGIRTFVKISVSTQRYALEGNSVNHGLGVSFDPIPRSESRNCPITGG